MTRSTSVGICFVSSDSRSERLILNCWCSRRSRRSFEMYSRRSALPARISFALARSELPRASMVRCCCVRIRSSSLSIGFACSLIACLICSFFLAIAASSCCSTSSSSWILEVHSSASPDLIATISSCVSKCSLGLKTPDAELVCRRISFAASVFFCTSLSALTDGRDSEPAAESARMSEREPCVASIASSRQSGAAFKFLGSSVAERGSQLGACSSEPAERERGSPFWMPPLLVATPFCDGRSTGASPGGGG